MHPYRIGHGYDRHRLEAGKPLIIGGVVIDAPFGSVAHSDGDVLLHALIDALLGAMALGDIGEHFPDTDPRWKGANSGQMLAHVLELVHDAGYGLVNLDATVLLETPKLKPYKFGIRQNLAEQLSVGLDVVSVKAKTGEKLAPVGTSEAIEAWVACLLARHEA